MDHTETYIVSKIIARELRNMNDRLPPSIMHRLTCAMIHLIDHKITRIGYRLDEDNVYDFFAGLNYRVGNREHIDKVNAPTEWIEQPPQVGRTQKDDEPDVLDPLLNFVDAVNEQVYRYCAMHTHSRVFITDVVLIMSVIYQDDTMSFEDVCRKLCD